MHEETLTLRSGTLKLRVLPNGNLALKPQGLRPEGKRTIESLATRYGGFWDFDFDAWIVVSRWIPTIREELARLG